MLAEMETQNRRAARDDLVAAVWEGEEPSRLLPLATAAGLTGDEADKLIARVCQAKEQLALVSQLPRLRKDAAGANGRFEKVQAQANAEIARLESQVQGAAYEAETAQKAVNVAESSSRQLLATYDDGLLPRAEAPEEVLRLIERRDAEEKFRQVDMTRAAAFEERNRRRAIVRSIEDRWANMPITLSSREDESLLRDRLKEATRQLAEAESALQKAEAKANAAHMAISRIG